MDLKLPCLIVILAGLGFLSAAKSSELVIERKIASFTIGHEHMILDYYWPDALEGKKLTKIASPEWVDISAIELEKKSQALLDKSGLKAAALSRIVSFTCQVKRTEKGLVWYYIVDLEDPRYPRKAGNYIPISVIILADGSDSVLSIRKFPPGKGWPFSKG